MKIEPKASYADGHVTIVNHGSTPVFLNGEYYNTTANRPLQSYDVPCLLGDDIKTILAAAQNILAHLAAHHVWDISRDGIEADCATIITLCSNTRIGDVRADLDPSSPGNRQKRSEQILSEQGFLLHLNGKWVWESWTADITNIPTVTITSEPPAFHIQYRRIL